LGIVGRQFGPRVPQAQASCYGIDTPMFEDPASAKFSYRTGYVGRLGRITIAPSLTDTSTVAPRRLVPRARQISEVANRPFSRHSGLGRELGQYRTAGPFLKSTAVSSSYRFTVVIVSVPQLTLPDGPETLT